MELLTENELRKLYLEDGLSEIKNRTPLWVEPEASESSTLEVPDPNDSENRQVEATAADSSAEVSSLGVSFR